MGRRKKRKKRGRGPQTPILFACPVSSTFSLHFFFPPKTGPEAQVVGGGGGGEDPKYLSVCRYHIFGRRGRIKNFGRRGLPTKKMAQPTLWFSGRKIRSFLDLFLCGAERRRNISPYPSSEETRTGGEMRTAFFFPVRRRSTRLSLLVLTIPRSFWRVPT